MKVIRQITLGFILLCTAGCCSGEHMGTIKTKADGNENERQQVLIEDLKGNYFICVPHNALYVSLKVGDKVWFEKNLNGLVSVKGRFKE